MNVKDEIRELDERLVILKRIVEKQESDDVQNNIGEVQSIIKDMCIGTESYAITHTDKKTITVVINRGYTFVGTHLTPDWLVNVSTANGDNKLRVVFVRR